MTDAVQRYCSWRLPGLQPQMKVPGIAIARGSLQFAIYQIVAFFMDNKNAIKINNLTVARW